MYRRRERKALRNSNNSKTRRGRRRSKHASESKTYFTNIKNMLRPLFLLFCFLHQENKKKHSSRTENSSGAKRRERLN
jgi:hypothetical protein